MIVSLAWLLIGIALEAGHIVALVVSWLGGWDEVAILATLIAVSAGLCLWAVWYGDRRDQQPVQAVLLPEDGPPLTVYEQAVIDAIERGEPENKTKGTANDR